MIQSTISFYVMEFYKQFAAYTTQQMQVTGFTRFALSFVTFVFGSGGVLFLVEPAITNYGDGLWYAFVTSTTVGYGDLHQRKKDKLIDLI